MEGQLPNSTPAAAQDPATLAFFQPGKYYIREERKTKEECYQVVKATRIEQKVPTKPYYYVELVGYWKPPGAFLIEDIRKYEILLFSFDQKDWRELKPHETDQVCLNVLNIFSRDGRS